jgi:hypothetical protein
MEVTPMKVLAVFSTAALAVLLGISVPVYAQEEEHPQEERRAQPEEKRAQPEDKAAHEQEKQVDKQREDKHADQDRRADQENKKEDKSAKQEDKSARQDERHQQRVDQREDHRGGRIPDDRFRANFGREHRFHIGRPVIVEGTPRFQYGGYWFVFVEPWPEGWGDDDEVYVDYIDGGYYLLSPVHPGVQISINVVF